MSARSLFTIIARAAQWCILRTRMWALSRYTSWRQISRPGALGIVGLAIAVVLSGVGYKLSLHRHAAHSARTPVAHLWIDSCDVSEAAASRLKAKSHHGLRSQLICVLIQRLPRFSRAVAYKRPVYALDLVYFDSLIPLRSPPRNRFSLA